MKNKVLAIIDWRTERIKGQACMTILGLIVPLHVIDKNYVRRNHKIIHILTDKLIRLQYYVVETKEIYESDIIILIGHLYHCKYNKLNSIEFSYQDPTELVGKKIDIYSIQPDGLKKDTTNLVEFKSIVNYSYQTISGKNISVKQIQILYFESKLKKGTSGAPICLHNSSSVIGFVHGNITVSKDNTINVGIVSKMLASKINKIKL